jgi:hypothetical protein
MLKSSPVSSSQNQPITETSPQPSSALPALADDAHAWGVIADLQRPVSDECYAAAFKYSLDRLEHPLDSGYKIIGVLMDLTNFRSLTLKDGCQDERMELKSHIVNGVVGNLSRSDRHYMREIFDEEAAVSLAANILHYADEVGGGAAGHKAIELMSILSLYADKIFPNSYIDSVINGLKFEPKEPTVTVQNFLDKYCQW